MPILNKINEGVDSAYRYTNLAGLAHDALDRAVASSAKKQTITSAKENSNFFERVQGGFVRGGRQGVVKTNEALALPFDLVDFTLGTHRAHRTFPSMAIGSLSDVKNTVGLAGWAILYLSFQHAFPAQLQIKSLPKNIADVVNSSHFDGARRLFAEATPVFNKLGLGVGAATILSAGSVTQAIRLGSEIVLFPLARVPMQAASLTGAGIKFSITCAGALVGALIGAVAGAFSHHPVAQTT